MPIRIRIYWRIAPQDFVFAYEIFGNISFENRREIIQKVDEKPTIRLKTERTEFVAAVDIGEDTILLRNPKRESGKK